jgi:hypothetical protein
MMGGMRASLVVAVLCAGCLEKIEVGGADGGASDRDGSALDAGDAGDLDDGDGGAAGDGGDSGDGGEIRDGGTDGGTAETPLRFGTMTVPNDQINRTGR